MATTRFKSSSHKIYMATQKGDVRGDPAKQTWWMQTTMLLRTTTDDGISRDVNVTFNPPEFVGAPAARTDPSTGEVNSGNIGLSIDLFPLIYEQLQKDGFLEVELDTTDPTRNKIILSDTLPT